MAKLRPVLERLRDRIPEPPGGLERLVRYREYKRRGQRLVTIGMALLVGLAGTLVAARAFVPPDRSSPADVLPQGAISFVHGSILAGSPIPDAEIYLMEPDGTDVHKLTNAAAESKVAAEPAWSPDGSKIVFVLSTPEHLDAYAGDGDIYVMNGDGMGLIRLTDDLDGAHPAWSPDGSRIVFVRDQGNSLVVVNADGSDQAEIRPDGKAFPPYQWPAWSPDGTRIAFQASPSAGVDTNRVYVTGIDGTGTRQVTSGLSDGYPAWSPDGTALAYAGPDGIYLHDPQTGTDHPLTVCGKREDCGFDFEPSWAPDGSRIVFTRQDYGGGSRQIFVVNADGTGLRQLTSGPDWNAEPSWQPTPISSGTPSPRALTPTPSPPTPTLSTVALPDGLSATRLAIGEGAVWTLASKGEAWPSVLVRIDPSTDQVGARTPLAGEPWYVAAGGGAVWVGSSSSSTIERIDATTNEVTAQIPLPGDDVTAMAADDQAVWVEVIQDRSDQGEQNLASLLRIDPRTNEVVATIPLNGLSGYDDEIAMGAGALWVAGVNLTGPSEERGANLVRIDPATNTISGRLRVPAFSVRAGADAVWVTAPADGVNDSLHKPEAWVAQHIDPTTNEVSAPIPLPGNVSGLLAVTADGVWFSGYDDQGRIQPVRLWDGVFDASVIPIDSYYTDVAFDETSGTIWVATTGGLDRIDLG